MTLGVERTTLLPGAVEALDAVRREGGRSVVVSARTNPRCGPRSSGSGSPPTRSSAGSGDRTRARCCGTGAAVYVGDHTGDMLAARTAGATPSPSLRCRTTPSCARPAPTWSSTTSRSSRLALVIPAPGSSRRARRCGWPELGSVMVAFSGGADSAFVLAAAVRALGPESVVAATAVSPSLPGSELDAAPRFASGLGVRHLTPTTDELARAATAPTPVTAATSAKSELVDVLVPAGRLARAGARGDRHQRGRRGGRLPARDPRRRRTGRGHAAARRRSRQGAGATRPAATGGLRPGTSRPRPACPAGSPTASRSPPSGCRGSNGPEPALRDALADAGIAVRDLRVRDLGDRARVEVDPERGDRRRRHGRASSPRSGIRDGASSTRAASGAGAMNELLPTPTGGDEPA